MNTRTIWKGHHYGSCVIRENFVFVPIPKCASTWMKHLFGKNRENFETSPSCLPAQAEFVVVLRDPIQRWISGLAQAMHGTFTDFELHYRNLGWEKIFDTVVFDNHTEPQFSFIQNIDFERTTWFELGPQLLEQVKSWSQNLVPLHFDRDFDESTINRMIDKKPLDEKRTLSGSTLLEEISTAVLSNADFQQRLREFYHRDFELYDTVPFYRAR